MFRKAYAIARQFTLPLVLSRKTVGGMCESSIASCVIVNDEGWIVTAGHVLLLVDKMLSDEQRTRKIEADRSAIENDPNLDRHEKKRRLRAVPAVRPEMTDRSSLWIGGLPQGTILKPASVVIPSVDLGVAQIESFDPRWIATYPVFKDSTKDFEAGASLCKLGFPFHEIVPTWNQASGMFELPAGAVPLPLFPIEGIFTRVGIVADPPGAAPAFPLMQLETSSPGLKGQSGGPTFDTEGAIWAIQTSTAHLHLGFSPKVPGGKRTDIEHQFLNVGLGVHVATLLGVFNDLKIKHTVSKH